ncbi:TetR family transcriptional regulator [Rhodococcoides trifolii]|uniref:TetR family transcriptional regulator n=1 Tax=Rhodococcoides trifolii TaxID=908250 RepID=A0A917FSJ6_9NOCA|nr:TetR/AcrR family transcriptional regulator [Rhodococcus trifolii]GGF98425.1 TetR family transcriptional regulator [Rhodococcus trifolii]
MGRTKTFDAADVVASARDLFWARGYEATSLPDLERATGLNRSSLYHSFVSKRGLFDAAVQNYLATVVHPRLRALTESHEEDAVDKYLAETVVDRGCLLVNAAAESAAHDAATVTIVSDYRRELTSALTVALARRFPEATDNDHRAQLLTSLLISSHLISRVDPDEAAALLSVARAQYVQWVSTPR